MTPPGGAAVDRGPPVSGRLVERYLLRLLAGPLAATLLLVLPALLLERLLRLFDLVASAGSPAASVMQLVLFLVPHYLGLALPAALFIAVYAVISRLSQAHELDALQAAGFSLGRIGRPFLLIGVLAAVFGLALLGWIQPQSRYAYRAALHAVTHLGWNAELIPGDFTRIGPRVMVRVGQREPTGGAFRDVLVHERREDGTRVVTTAARGTLVLDLAAGEAWLALEDGSQMTVPPDGELRLLTFGEAERTRPFVQRLSVFRRRGTDEREMTLPELRDALRDGGTDLPPAKLTAELHGRLVRAASLLLLPLLAIPMGLAAKRSRRASGIVLGTLILVLYNQALNLLESLGDVERLHAPTALWTAFGAFALFCLFVFVRSHRRPDEGAFDPLLAALDGAGRAMAGLMPRRS